MRKRDKIRLVKESIAFYVSLINLEKDFKTRLEYEDKYYRLKDLLEELEKK